jgi:predicted ATP-binding protein involved in virulence
MQLKEIIVENLFNAFDHHIRLNEKLTIMIGENGYGKTTILNMLRAVADWNYVYFHSIVFTKFQLVFDNQTVTVEKKDNNVFLNGHKIIDGSIYENEMLITIKNNYSDIDIHQQDSLYDLILNHKLGKAQIFMRTYNQRMIREYKKIYELKNFSSILLIGTKRIDMYAPLFYLNKFTQEKLYENEKIKSQLFITILNNYFLNKNIALENNKLVIYSAITQKIIPIMALSSGEQHLFVLFYSLLFRTKPNTFVLFDEPETSLHITWQNRFIDDLLQIIDNIDGLTTLIATHSPNLIAHHWNLTVELSEAKNYEVTR